MDDRQSLTPANSADKPTSSSLTANEMEAVRTTVDGELESSRKRSGSSRKRSGSSRKRSRSSRKRTGSSSQKTDSCPTQEQHLHEDKKRKREDVDEDPDVKTDPPETKQKPKEKKQRCFTCHKKVGVIGFDCRCQNVFCSLHRHSDVHNCTFDYKAYGAEKIRRENPVVVKEKIQKI